MLNGNGRRCAVYIGHDSRQPLSYNCMRYSVESNASSPISVNGLFLHQLPITRQKATEFTFSRFLVPWLMDFEGFGLFCDEDMVVTGDVWELFSYCSKIDGEWDVAMMTNQPPFEWPSVMMFNNRNLKHITPEYVEDEKNRFFDFAWTTKERVADLPEEWNHGCGMMPPKEAKLYHFSQGIPYWTECRGLHEDEKWFEAMQNMTRSANFVDLHKETRHFPVVMSRFLAQYGLKIPNADKHYKQ
jgi:hypothetical protein